jgi:hypothetical protein
VDKTDAYLSCCKPPSLAPPQPPLHAPSGTQLPTQLIGGHGLELMQLMLFLHMVSMHQYKQQSQWHQSSTRLGNFWGL